MASELLDTHLRIAQTEVSKDRMPGPAGAHVPAGARSWHTDWPHDLTAYGPSAQEPWRHCGAIAQPFPDVCMALTTIWYLGPEDVSPHNGATMIVPGR